MKPKRWGNLRFLLVDDRPVDADSLIVHLENQGFSASTRPVVPLSRSGPLGGAQLPPASEWDGFDFALLDLDLGSESRYEGMPTPEQFRGATEFLPAIRLAAPWLPVIAFSGHYGSGPRFIAIVGMFGVDAHLPKGTEKDQDGWIEFFDRIAANRLGARIGERQLLQATGTVDVAFANHIVTDYGFSPDVVRQLVAHVFGYAERVVFDGVPAGYSGAVTYRAKVTTSNARGGRSSEWLLKIGRSPSRLQRELDAHLRLQREGIGLLRSVPPLWPTVVTHERTGAIAYQFGAGTVDGRGFLLASGLPRLLAAVKPAMEEFYSTTVRDARDHSSAVLQVVPRGDKMMGALDAIGNGPIRSRLLDIVRNAPTHENQRRVEYTKSLLHGDLHLGNVMLGERALFIDFANSCEGPVASDLAGLVASLCLLDESARAGVSFAADLSSCEVPALEEFVAHFLGAPDDRRLFAELLAVYLTAASAWDATLPDVRAWIVSSLTP